LERKKIVHEAPKINYMFNHYGIGPIMAKKVEGENHSKEINL
jgi:hypothetical protein